MSEAVDLLIVGAGPAGMAAALEARAGGLSALVLDENRAAGGQVWRAAEANAAGGGSLGADYAAGAAMAEALRKSEVPTRFGATVWAIEPEGRVYYTVDGTAQSVEAGRVLLATGALERPLPIPGWTLPGVMTVGAAQILLKTAGLRPEGRVWIAGQGPLVRLFAVQALAAGGSLAGILDLAPPASSVLGIGDLPALAGASDLVAKGVRWGRTITAAGVRWHPARSIRAEAGDDGRLARVRFQDGRGERAEDADLLLLHDGVIPNTQITRALGLRHVFDAGQRSWRPVLDAMGRSSLPLVLVAGDGGFILGAEGALITGRLAAIAAAADLGKLDAETAGRRTRPLLKRLSVHRKFRTVLDKLYPARAPVLDDSATVCRCEEVTAGEVRAAAGLGCLGLNQMKSFTRCGMGPCQGRMCASTAAELLAEARGVRLPEIEPYRGRFPTKPLTLGELAALEDA
ncbi:MAG: FAD-dependent oxidoreductase [Acetobacteraceae bacterium]|nr:FAD-dependent oxidoreductase [Acetobacteraceae bacterium]